MNVVARQAQAQILLSEITSMLRKGKQGPRLDRFNELLRFKIENFLEQVEWEHELQMIEIEEQRDLDLAERARRGDKEAQFLIKLRCELHQAAITRLTT